MKAMKYLLIVIAFLGCSTVLKATEYKLYETSSATYKTPTSMSRVGNKARGGIYTHTGNNVCPTSIENSTVSFHSTSAMLSSGSALPNAAVSGFISADDNLPGSSPRGPRRVIDEDDKDEEKPESWRDPMEDPITDAVPCLLLLAIGYAIYLGRKTSVPNPDSRK